MWNIPGAGVTSVSPILAGALLSTLYYRGSPCSRIFTRALPSSEFISHPHCSAFQSVKRHLFRDLFLSNQTSNVGAHLTSQSMLVPLTALRVCCFLLFPLVHVSCLSHSCGRSRTRNTDHLALHSIIPAPSMVLGSLCIEPINQSFKTSVN